LLQGIGHFFRASGHCFRASVLSFLKKLMQNRTLIVYKIDISHLGWYNDIKLRWRQ
jgi:hypothetical protein